MMPLAITCAACAMPIQGSHYEREDGDYCEPCGRPGALHAWAQRSIAWLDQRGIQGPERDRLLHAWGVPA